ncbi:MAG: dephospho-CoA kinase [Planctomycetota bacterium]|jgi:dephospho-CoA kinase
MAKKPIIGILGGIGSGKSTVAAAFGGAGGAVIDADAIVHSLLEREDVRARLIDVLGVGILNSNGLIDRSVLAKVAFGQPETLKFLTDVLHPRVLKRTETLIEVFQADPNIRGIVLDMPLLLEVGWEKKCDFLVFVDCCEEKRRRRIKKNAKIDIEQLKIRENFQISLDKKKEKAHYRINNNSDKSDMAEQVAQIFSSMTGSK